MPRRPRELVEGAIYHVYNRIARGEDVFSERAGAERFLDILLRARDRDGVTILAWCLMSNHYHLALRTGVVPLSRTMGFVQARFGRQHNQRSGLAGPLWQSRYKGKVVADEGYVLRLISYIHLNPVAAGLVADPGAYSLSGHRELVGAAPPRLIDVDGTLALFADARGAARRSYLALLKGGRKASWIGEGPGKLPWWQRQPDVPIEKTAAWPRLDALGGSNSLRRQRLDAGVFVERTCAILDVPMHRLSSVEKDREVSALRYLLGGLAIERWRIGAKQLGEVLGRRSEVVSRWAARAGELRQEDSEFRHRYDELDAALSRTSGDSLPVDRR